uniref:Uncharacterized protein n=1 Tax=Rhipicephalus zambeziensis TaxID=60191 RepID=A0A224YHF3_9ACAR
MLENNPFLSIAAHPTDVTTSQKTFVDLFFENQALVQQLDHISTHFSGRKVSVITIKYWLACVPYRDRVMKINSGIRLYIQMHVSLKLGVSTYREIKTLEQLRSEFALVSIVIVGDISL